MITPAPSRSPRRGSALLTVLWVSAALAAVGFALADTVRSETDRASTTVDEIRAYYLATGAVDRAAIEILWASVDPNKPGLPPKRTTRLDYQFPTGLAHVEIIPEAAKFDVNTVSPERLGRMLTFMGVDPGRIPVILESIAAWRAGRGAAFSSVPLPTFSPSATSFQEIEELLAVRGITPEIFYGTYTPVADPVPGQARLIRRSGLIDCLSVFGSKEQIDANTADPAVLAGLGMPLPGIEALIAERNRKPLDEGKLAELAPLTGAAAPSLRLEGHSILTVRATGQVRLPDGRLSDAKRTVAALVKYMPKGFDSPIHILRWYDNAWSN